ncbi:MAG: nucleotide-binding protein [Acidobacteria bacterium]|nr:nucleotide-binding protein [Acidobacteriota bacterium]
MRPMFVILFAAAALLGCKKSETPAAQAPVAAPPSPAPGASVTGKILERLEAPPYVYFRLKVGDQEVWAAVPENKLAVGEEATLANAMEMRDFESKTLKRTFPSILFANLGTGGAPTSMANMASQHAMAAKGGDEVAVGKVDKAPGAEGRSIAELYAQKGTLKDKTVAVRARVVKVSLEIMGKNWLHLRDGSGDPAKGDHDLTVTSADKVEKGDLVLVRGTLRLDKNYGSGYAYPVILEDAKAQKQ